MERLDWMSDIKKRVNVHGMLRKLCPAVGLCQELAFLLHLAFAFLAALATIFVVLAERRPGTLDGWRLCHWCRVG